MNRQGSSIIPKPSQNESTGSTRGSKPFKDVFTDSSPDDTVAAIAEVRERLKRMPAPGMQPQLSLRSLEATREAVSRLQADSAAGYRHGQLPLASGEHELWQASIELRIDVATAYEACANAGIGATPSQPAAAWEAVALQRALRELGLTIIEHARVRIEVSPDIWKRFHALYLRAEMRGIADSAVPGAQPGSEGLANCRSTYLHALLFHRAQPYGMTVGQMEYVARWLDQWAALAALHRMPLDGNPLTALVVDLAEADGIKLLRSAPQGPQLRYVETRRLGSKLKEMSAGIGKEQSAAGAGSANDFDKAALARLMTSLFVQWCSAGTGRASARIGAASKAMVTLTVPGTHFYISGRGFRQPGQGYTREEDEDLQTFGHITQRTMQKLVSQRSSALEPWSIANESSGGMLALCRQPDLRTRVAHGQMLGVMRRSDKPLELVVVQWLMLAQSGELEVGVRRIDGLPQAVAVRPAASAHRPGIPGAHAGEKYQRALLLPAIPEKSLPARLLLEPGTYVGGTSVDVYIKEKVSGRLLDPVDKGPNFELFAFERG